MAGLPVWVWGLALAGGLVLGVYLRRRPAGGQPQQPEQGGVDQTGTLGAGATPTDNGLGSPSVDMAGFTQSIESGFQALAGQLADLSAAVQESANQSAMGFYGYPDTSLPPVAPVGPQPTNRPLSSRGQDVIRSVRDTGRLPSGPRRPAPGQNPLIKPRPRPRSSRARGSSTRRY